MAKKLELSNPDVAALMGQHKKLIPWVSAGYDDEETLFQLRAAHPTVEWSILRDLFNQVVPPRRRRSKDSIKNKWRVLRARFRDASQATPARQVVLEGDVSHCCSESDTVLMSHSTAMQAPPAMQTMEGPYNIVPNQKFLPANDMLCEPYMDNQNSLSLDQSIVSLDAMNENFANYSEMLSAHWDSMADFDGYFLPIADELERMQAARQVAIEAASGMQFCSEGRKAQQEDYMPDFPF